MIKISNLQFTIYNSKNKQRGFTLIELLVTIGIIGILSSFLLANFVGVRQRARDGVRKSDLRQIQSALELYRADMTVYPNPGISSCGSPIEGGSPVVTYMLKIPCDPSSVASYQYSSTGSTYCLRTCLENTNDNDRDEMKIGSDNPSISGCTLQSCVSGKSYSLQNP
jgi:prepilin-type N-terminal cleavage/methylation domain-containing protein